MPRPRSPHPRRLLLPLRSPRRSQLIQSQTSSMTWTSSRPRVGPWMMTSRRTAADSRSRTKPGRKWTGKRQSNPPFPAKGCSGSFCCVASSCSVSLGSRWAEAVAPLMSKSTRRRCRLPLRPPHLQNRFNPASPPRTAFPHLALKILTQAWAAIRRLANRTNGYLLGRVGEPKSWLRWNARRMIAFSVKAY